MDLQLWNDETMQFKDVTVSYSFTGNSISDWNESLV